MSYAKCSFCLATFPTITAARNHEEFCKVHSVERVHWYETSQKLPDDETSVLIFGPGLDTCEGFLEADTWHLANGVPIEGAVSHWAEMPMGPYA